jgi:hypothetical protein
MVYLPISGEGAPSLKSLAKVEQELNEPSSPIAPMLMGVELLIYDLDGVIIDSTEAICIAFN